MTQQGYVFYRKKNQAQPIISAILYAEHNILRSDPSCTLFPLEQFKDSKTEISFVNKRLKLVLLSKTNMPKHSERRAFRLRNTTVCLRKDNNDLHPFWICELLERSPIFTIFLQCLLTITQALHSIHDFTIYAFLLFCFVVMVKDNTKRMLALWLTQLTEYYLTSATYLFKDQSS